MFVTSIYDLLKENQQSIETVAIIDDRKEEIVIEKFESSRCKVFTLISKSRVTIKELVIKNCIGFYVQNVTIGKLFLGTVNDLELFQSTIENIISCDQIKTFRMTHGKFPDMYQHVFTNEVSLTNVQVEGNLFLRNAKYIFIKDNVGVHNLIFGRLRSIVLIDCCFSNVFFTETKDLRFERCTIKENLFFHNVNRLFKNVDNKIGNVFGDFDGRFDKKSEHACDFVKLIGSLI